MIAPKLMAVLATLLFFLGLLPMPAVAANTDELTSDQWRMTEEQWDLIKQGEQLLLMPVMQQVTEAWSVQQEYGIELRYPGGEEGELWVEELMNSLISLAIPSQYLFAVPSSGEADVIIIKIFKLGDV